MNFKRLICLWLILYLIFPPQCWSQPVSGKESEKRSLEEQAQIQLQKIGPSPGIDRQLLPQAKPLPPPTEEPAKVVTAAPRQIEEVSAAEKRAAEYGLKVKQFGYSFFYKPPETFLPVQAVPVGPDYMIGPGDSLKVLLWGSVQGEYNLLVDRNGQISIPKVGVVQVSGLTYKQLREVMEREFVRQYTNFQMNVTLDSLRTIQVYVVGQARFPGSYSVSSLSTLISALFAAGGPSKTGTLRDIQVRRGKKIIAHFDMYDFLFRGDESKDIRLQSGDVITIPPIGPLAAIGSTVRETLGVAATEGKAEGAKVDVEPIQVGGPIKVPAIYELKNEKTLNSLLNLAGGLSGTAFKGRVQVLRVQNNREMVLFEDDLNKVMTGKTRDVMLVDGDFVKIFRVPDGVEKKVRLAGTIKTVGEFGLFDSMRVKDLIEYAGGLLMESNREEAEITRVTITPQGPQTSRIYFSPRRALSGYPQDNIILKPNDYIFIRSIPDWTLYTVVKIEGEVKFPGNYAIKKGETMSSVLTRAGGFSDKAYPRGAVFTREAVKKVQTEHLKQMIDRVESEMYSSSTEQTQVSLEKEDIERQKAVVIQQRQFIAKMRTVVPLGRVVIRLDDAERLRGTPDDLEMEDNDSLTVPRVQQTVNVLGSVVSPTAVVYSPYFTVKDYIKQAGGPAKNADVNLTYVLKVNGAAISSSGSLFGRVGSTRLDPGDSIIVPENLEKVAWLREIKDIATIIGQIALTAGVVLVGMK